MTADKIERRLSTILAADIVGYSRMVSRDEAGTISAVKALVAELIEPKATQYNGRIVKLMGDGMLMEFSSVVEAVSFAVEIQCAVSSRNEASEPENQIIFRIGINIGDIIVDADDIHGNGVNIAARLESIAAPGEIYISDAVFDQVQGKIDLTFTDVGEKTVKNIDKPVRVHSIRIDDRARSIATEIQKRPAKRRYIGYLAGAALGLVVVAGGVMWLLIGTDRQPPSAEITKPLELPSKPSVAVLPFQSIGEDDTAAYFSNGLTNDLIADLSRFHGLFVSASNSVFALRDKQLTAQAAASNLGVRYILEGSAQNAGSRLRVNVNLIDATDGNTIWTERYDRDVSDVFAVQDDIVSQIVSAMTVQVEEAELQRSRAVRPADMQAYDYFLRGRDLDKQETRSTNFEAQQMLQTAIELDPAFALAYTALASSILSAATEGWANDPRQALKRAHDIGEAAIAIKPHAEGHALMGWVFLLMRHFDLAAAELDKAIKLNPNDAGSFSALGSVSLWTSKLDDAIIAFEKSIRLDPVSGPETLFGLGTALFLKGEYQQALAPLSAAELASPERLLTQMMLAATNLKLGRRDEAEAAAARIRKLHPFFESENYKNAFSDPAHGQSIVDALSTLGFE